MLMNQQRFTGSRGKSRNREEKGQQTHLSERSLSDDLDRPEVVQPQPGPPQPEEARLCPSELGELTLLALVGLAERCRGGFGSETLLEIGAAAK